MHRTHEDHRRPPTLVAQVHDAIVTEIAQGKLLPGERVIQEQLAQGLGFRGSRSNKPCCCCAGRAYWSRRLVAG